MMPEVKILVFTLSIKTLGTPQNVTDWPICIKVAVSVTHSFLTSQCSVLLSTATHQRKMKLIIATCLLVMIITITECKHEKRQVSQYCQDALSNTDSAAYKCLVEYASGTCTDECLTELVRYADECLGSEAAAEAYKMALEQACGNDTGFCQDALSNTDSAIYKCLVEYASGTCTDECLTELVRYADECLGSEAAAEAYKMALEQACGNDAGFCQDALSNTDSAVYKCLVKYASGTCTDECITELVKYADECLGSEAAAEAYKMALEDCPKNGGGDGDGSGDDATTVAATLFSTITALLVAMAAALN